MTQEEREWWGDGYLMGYKHGHEEALESVRTWQLVAEKLGVNRGELNPVGEPGLLAALGVVRPYDAAARLYRYHEGYALLRETGVRLKGEKWGERYDEGYASGQADGTEGDTP